MRILCCWLAATLSFAWADERIAGWAGSPRANGTYQGEEIRYRVVDGLAVVEGDIILGPAEQDSKHRAGLVVINTALRWPENRVVYQIDPALPNQARVTVAIAEWEKKTPFRFVERTTETDYVRIRRVTSGCSATLGRVRGEQFVNLEDGCSTGNTIHELGHTLGLYHTQSRRDRYAFLTVNYANIDKRDWDQYDGQLRAFEVGPYDYGSIMHYARTGFSRNSQPSSESNPPGIPVGQRSTLSSGDILAAYRIAEQAFPGFVVDTIPSGLPVMVDGESVTTPRVYENWKPGQEHTIEAFERAGVTALSRHQFVRWAQGGDRQQRVILNEANRLLVAHFAQDVLVRAMTPGGGTVRLEPAAADGFYRVGTVVQITAEAAEGFNYVNWTAGVNGFQDNAANGLGQAQNPSRIAVLRESLIYQANFTRSPVTTVTTDPPGIPVTVNGVTSAGPRGFGFAVGAMQAASAQETVLRGNDTIRYRFTGWTRNGEPVDGRELSFPGPAASVQLVAKFTREHLVSYDTDWLIIAGSPRPSLANVELNPSSEGGYYPAGTLLNLKGASTETFRFTHWSYDFTGTAAEQQVEVTDQIYGVANFLSPALINARAIVSASSLQPNFGVSPGELLWVHSPEVGAEDAVNAEPADGVWPETLAGLRVLFDGRPGNLVRVERNRILVAAPLQLPEGLMPVLVDRGGTRRGTPQLGSVNANPAVETRNGLGLGEAGRAAPGGIVEIRFTGGGVTAPASAPGRAAAGPPALPVSVRVGGRELPIRQVSPVAERPNTFRIELQLPDDMATGMQALQVGVGARGSQTGVWVLVTGGA